MDPGVYCQPYSAFNGRAAEKVRRLLLRRPNHQKLTRQERAILDLLVEGLGNAEIASSLCVELKTVKNHLTRLFAKLGVSNRLEAVARYLEMEASPPQPDRAGGEPAP